MKRFFLVFLIPYIGIFVLLTTRILYQNDPSVSILVTEEKSQAFELAVREAYGKIKTIPRQKNQTAVDFSNWQELHGGLRKADREKLVAIYSSASSVFEFGVGESTLLAAKVQVPRYTGVDSDAQWVAQARDQAPPHFRFHLADIGAVGKWGYPKQNHTKNLFDYQLAALMTELEPFDVYMVDGRWRLPCMLISFLHASARGAPTDGTRVLLHDCKPSKSLDPTRRNVYHYADTLLDLMEDDTGSKLCVYRRKQGTTDAQILRLWKKYNKEWK